MERKIKKTIAMLLVVMMLMTSVPLQGLAVDVNYNGFVGGRGTLEDPYLVSTPTQLNNIRNYLNSSFKLINDIDMSKWGEWTPIGTSSSVGSGVPPYNQNIPNVDNAFFTGNFNGNGKIIKGLTIKDDSANYLSECYGLFAATENATLKNIYLYDINYSINKDNVDYEELYNNYYSGFDIYVGGIVARATDTIIENCMVTGSISVEKCSGAYVGGILAYVNTGYNGYVKNCINKTNMYVFSDRDSRYVKDSTVNCGGIIGRTGIRNFEISECSNYGNIESTGGAFSNVGGISGRDCNILNCVNFGNVFGRNLGNRLASYEGANTNAGGIVGATSNEKIINCVNYGEIYANCAINSSLCIGGISGFSKVLALSSCVNNSSTITATIQNDADKSDYFYRNTGRITGVGVNISNCYSLDVTKINNEISTTEEENHINGKSVTKTELLSKDVYINYDFENLWEIDGSKGGAVLKSQKTILNNNHSDHFDSNSNCICDYCDTPLSHTSEEIPAVPATCTETGLTAGAKCSVCGEILIAQTIVPVIPHNYGECKVMVAPTCNANGLEVHTCICGEEEIRTVNASGHSYGDDNVCDSCGEVKQCSCNCHKSGFMAFIWKIINFFQKLFRINPTCSCGKAHY